MKDIYLVKKNPALTDEDNWIYMNMNEFADFLHTPEGLRRTRFFQRLGRCCEDDYGIIIECTEEIAKEVASERRHAKYLNQLRRKAKPIILSLLSPIDDSATESFADMIPADVDVAQEAVDHVLIEKLCACLPLLPAEDLDLIESLYLRDNPLTVQDYCKRCDVSLSTIYKRRARILSDLRIMLKCQTTRKED